MVTYKGKILSEGTAIAKAFLLGDKKTEDKNTEQFGKLSEEEVKYQSDRVEKAVRDAVSFLEKIEKDRSLEKTFESTDILEAYIGILTDTTEESLFERIRSYIKENKVCAEAAVETVGKIIAEEFLKSDSEYFRARGEDFYNIADILTEQLDCDGKSGEKDKLTEPSIVVAKSLSPERLLSFEKRYVKGIVTQNGSLLSHTAILAESMNIPYVSGINAEMIKKDILNDDTEKTIIIDGENVTVNPDEETLLEITNGTEGASEQISKDVYANLSIEICANIEKPEDVTNSLSEKVSGIGLFRTEFMYIGRDEAPGEEEQYEAYVRVLDAMDGKPVCIRTLDAGADKDVRCLGIKDTKLRGIKLCFERPKIFETQIRALLRAANHGNLRIMFPMITSKDDVLRAKEIVQNVAKALEKEKIKYYVPKIGIMVETAEAVQCMEELAKIVDFVSIGTNDLTQSVLGIDRTADSFEYSEIQIEEILGLVRKIVNEAKKNKIRVGICGEMGGDTNLTGRLLEMGVDELSMPFSKMSKIAIKLRELNV